MGLASRRSTTVRWFAALIFVVGAESAVRAQDAEIAGIERVYLRDGPGSDRPNLGVLNAGDHVRILGTDGSWVKVETREGKVGFVYHRYVSTQANPTSTSESPQGDTAVESEPLAPPVAAPAVPAAPDEISAEIANLRTEVADLKQKIQERSAEAYTTRPNETVPSGSPTVSAAGSGGFGARSARDQSAGVLVVALLSLLVGWVLGSAFTRRRSRSQRSRLRL